MALKDAGWTVLVARANQVRVAFTLPGGGRKAPDVVALKAERLLVLEAKADTLDLFRAVDGRPSDFEAMVVLQNNAAAQQELVSRLAVPVDIEATRISAGLVCLNELANPEALESAGLVGLVWSPESGLTVGAGSVAI